MRTYNKRLAFFLAVAFSVTSFMVSTTDANYADFAAENLDINVPFATYALALGETKSWEVPLTYTLIKTNVDVMYVIDTTGSMAGIRATLASTLGKFSAQLIEAGAKDIQFGAAFFGDYDFDEPWFGIELPLGSHSLETVQDALNDLFLTDGGDVPEDAIWAYMRAASETSWRADAEHIIVLVTDQPAKIRSSASVGGYPAEPEGMRELSASIGIKPAVLPYGSATNYDNAGISGTATVGGIASALGVSCHPWVNDASLLDALVAAAIQPTDGIGSHNCEARVESIRYDGDNAVSTDVSAYVVPSSFVIKSGEKKSFALTAVGKANPARMNDMTVVEIGFYVDGSRISSATQRLYYQSVGYNVTFVSWDEAVLKKELVPPGGAATAPDAPSRLGWTFTGWDREFSNITEDITVTAQYALNAFNVIFKDWKDTELKRETVSYGGAATAPSPPPRTGWTFTEWDKAFGYVTEDLVVTAQYKINYYTVIFKDHDGNVLRRESVAYEGAATAPPNPSRPGWAFKGWDKAFNYITADLVVNAIYDLNGFTVKFVDWDEAELKTETVSYGEAATAPANPSRVGWTFIEWDKAFSYIIADTTVTALYKINYYTVIFLDHDGTELKRQSVAYGGAATAPTPSRTGWRFAGWDKAFNYITADLVVNALYDLNGFNVVFVDWNGVELKHETVSYGGAATAPADPSRTGWTFDKWDKAFSYIIEDTTVTALYKTNFYLVVFEDWKNDVVKFESVFYGEAATAPPPPPRTGWTFVKWDKEFSYITEDLVVTALYEINKYDVKFVDWNDVELKEETVSYGGAATAPASPSRVGWTFTGWDKAFSYIIADTTVKALYKINYYTVDFVDWDGAKLKSEQVAYGGAATAPTSPSRTGWAFDKWDKAFNYITGNLTVNALYNINNYTVDFVDWNGALLKSEQVPYEGAATAPASPSRVGRTFVGWDKTFNKIIEDTTVTAQYVINYYTVEFVDWDDEQIKSERVPYGGAAAAPASPSRTGWTFDKWDKAFNYITGDLTVNALYNINYYNVVFKDWDEVELKSEDVPYEGAATAPEDPSRTGWTFAGWDKAFDFITEDLVVTARFNINYYTVDFVDWDEEGLKSERVPFKGAATAPEDPSRDGWTFLRWDKEFDCIIEDTTVTAEYRINSFTVIFEDHDGHELKRELVSFEGAAKAPASPSRVGWTFTGWDKDFSRVTKDITVTAQYKINYYTVTFLDWDDEQLKTQLVPYEGAATAPTEPSRTGWTFIGWDKTFGKIIEDTTVTALYNIKSFNVIFKDWDGTELKREVVQYGGAAKAPADPARVGWTFTGWDKDYGYIIDDLVVTAQYLINYYDVVFEDWDGEELKAMLIPYGGAAKAPEDPSRTGWTFTGWDKAFNYITEDLVVTALYKINYYNVDFLDWDGEGLKSESVPYEGAAKAPAAPSRVGWTFTGWDKAFNYIIDDLVVTAQYKINYYAVDFVDWDGKALKKELVPYEGAAKAPEDPPRVGWTFTGWDKEFGYITEDLVVTAQYTINYYTVTFYDDDETYIYDEDVPYGGSATPPEDPEDRPDWAYSHWDGTYTDVVQDEDVYAVYKEIVFTLTYAKGDHGAFDDITLEGLHYGVMAPDPSADPEYTISAQSGWIFSGWEPELDIVTSDAEYVAQWTRVVVSAPKPAPPPPAVEILSPEPIPTPTPTPTPEPMLIDSHIWYIRGYEDNTIRPDDPITRAEIAMVFYRLLDPRLKSVSPGDSFNDVAGAKWYGLAVNLLAYHGIVNGYKDGSYKPDQPITRSELAAIVSRFENLVETDDNPYNDLDAFNWAYKYILSATKKGWFIGDGDGRFRPNDDITRAEFVTVANRVLNRHILVKDIPGTVHQFDGFSSRHWSYPEFMEAIYTHDYVRKADGVNEEWTEITEDGIQKPYNQ